MRRLAFLVALSALASGCSGDPSRVSGTDEHGNAVTARVRVVDTVGTPVPGAEVLLFPSGWLDSDSTGIPGGTAAVARATTGADGSCSIPNPGPSALFRLRAGEAEIAATASVRGASDTQLVLVLNRTGSVQGTLGDGSGGVPVRVPGLPGGTVTDSKGRFSLGFLPVGAFRLRFGSGAAMVVLDPIAIRSRKTIDLGTVPVVEGDTLPRPAPEGTVLDLPATPRFQPGGGTVPVGQAIQISADAGDPIETSTDGILWTPLNGSLRLMASQCVRARAVHDSRILSSIAVACYEVQP